MSNLSYHQPRVPLGPNRLLLRTISGHKSYVSSVAFLGTRCDHLITGSYDEMAKLWDLKTGRCLRKFSGHTDGVTFVMQGPEGRVLTASEDRTLRVWDTDTGECTRIIRSHSGAVTGLCMAGPDRIVTGSADKKLRVFDITGQMCGEAELDSEIMAIASPLLPLPAVPSRTAAAAPAAAAATGSGSGSSSSSSSGGDADKKPPCQAPPEGASSVGVGGSPLPSPSTVRVLACGGAHIPTPAKPMLRSVDVETGVTAGAVAPDAGTRFRSNLCTARLDDDEASEKGVVTCVAISAAGAKGRGILVAGCYDKCVRVLRNVLSSSDGEGDDVGGLTSRNIGGASRTERATGDGVAPPVSMRVLGRHAEGVRSVAISADGRWAVSGGREGRVKVWEIPREAPTAETGEGEPEAEADFEAHRGIVFSLCMSRDARVLVSGGSDKDVRVWDLSLVVYARRMAVNRSRALWAAGRIRRARPKRGGSSSSGGGGGGGSSGMSSPKRTCRGGSGGGATPALKAFESSREQRQQILESLFALPEIIYAKILMCV